MEIFPIMEAGQVNRASSGGINVYNDSLKVQPPEPTHNMQQPTTPRFHPCVPRLRHKHHRATPLRPKRQLARRFSLYLSLSLSLSARPPLLERVRSAHINASHSCILALLPSPPPMPARNGWGMADLPR